MSFLQRLFGKRRFNINCGGVNIVGDNNVVIGNNHVINRHTKRVKGNGKMKDLEFDNIRDFREIELNLPAKLYYTVDDKPYLKMTIDENLIGAIECKAQGDTAVFQLTHDWENASIEPTEITIVLATKDINKVVVNGSGEVHMGYITPDHIKTFVNGSGSVDFLYIGTKSVVLSISGSGNINVKDGNITNMIATVGGSGSIDSQANCKKTRAEIFGSGCISVTCSDSLFYDIAGSGHVLFRGDCSYDGNIFGSGLVRRL